MSTKLVAKFTTIVFTKNQYCCTFIPEVMKFLVKLCLLSKSASQNLGDRIFSSMLTLELASELNTTLEL
jgi:hypothetical protein